jgi:hypothetical protein
MIQLSLIDLVDSEETPDDPQKGKPKPPGSPANRDDHEKKPMKKTTKPIELSRRVISKASGPRANLSICTRVPGCNVVGIANGGNTCFMNAALQCLVIILGKLLEQEPKNVGVTLVWLR